MPYAVDNAKKILGKKPAFGICMGHQVGGLGGLWFLCCHGAVVRSAGAPSAARPGTSCRVRPASCLRLLLTCRSALALPDGLQVIGQALGGKTFKLKFGHHGGNHPLRHTPTGACCFMGKGCGGWCNACSTIGW